MALAVLCVPAAAGGALYGVGRFLLPNSLEVTRTTSIERPRAAVFARDFDLQLANACGVDRTGAAVVLDATGRMVYRGRVDDQRLGVGRRLLA